MTLYFAHISHQGKIRYGDVPGSIGLLEVLDNFMPIGEHHAAPMTRTGWPCGRSGSGSRRSLAGGLSWTGNSDRRNVTAGLIVSLLAVSWRDWCRFWAAEQDHACGPSRPACRLPQASYRPRVVAPASVESW